MKKTPTPKQRNDPEILIDKKTLICDAVTAEIVAECIRLKAQKDDLDRQIKEFQARLTPEISHMLDMYRVGTMTIRTDAGDVVIREPSGTVEVQPGREERLLALLEKHGKEVSLYLKTKYTPLAPLKKLDIPEILECLIEKPGSLSFSYPKI